MILPLINAQTHAPNIPVNVDMLTRCELIYIVWFICMCFPLNLVSFTPVIFFNFFFKVTLL